MPEFQFEKVSDEPLLPLYLIDEKNEDERGLKTRPDQDSFTLVAGVN